MKRAEPRPIRNVGQPGALPTAVRVGRLFAGAIEKATRATGSSFSLSNGATVTLKCVIGDDPGNSALQELKVYVAGTLRLTTTAIDDTWQGGHVGVWRASASTTTTLQWDNFKCGNFWILLSDSKVVYEQMML